MKITISIQAFNKLRRDARSWGMDWVKPMAGETEIAIEVDDEVYERLNHIAARDNVTISEAILGLDHAA